MTDNPPARAGEGRLTYSYRPSLLGAPWEFVLTGETLDFRAGRKAGRVSLRKIRRMRLSFRPIAMQSQRFLAEIWAGALPSWKFARVPGKNMVEQERFDRAYATFVEELHRHVAQEGGAVRFEQGSSPLLYWPGLAIFVVVSLALAALVVHGL